MYDEKLKQYIMRVKDKLIESQIREKGLVNVLEELQGSMNDSIRVLKCVTHEEHVWLLIEEDMEYAEDEAPQQYWIREVDLSPEEKEYIHQYLPISMREEDVVENEPANKAIRKFTKEFRDLRDERKEMLKELREIRFGMRVSYFCMESEFDEDTEQKLHEYNLKFIEYEDDITFLTENLQEQKLHSNDLELQVSKLKKRIEELNSIILNISKGSNDSVENFLKSYKKANELIHQNKMLQEEIDSKNEEIESLKNSSMVIGRPHEFSPHKKEESKSEGKIRIASF